tara:strand:+ start:30144 stop:31004 length:861 start_codon:yes stop_codon:yes gene_type:complete
MIIMIQINNIGIVGQGFVGTAVKEGMSKFYEIYTYDKYVSSKSNVLNLQELCDKTKIIFVCLPTPMLKNGRCDTSVVEKTIKLIDTYNKNNIVILKSTVPPGTTEHLNRTSVNTPIVFNPEFLTEANYVDDFKNQNRIIIGGPRPASTIVKNVFRKAFPQTQIVKTSSSVAECVKYFTNTFLATKVSFANEFKTICSKINVDYDKVLEYAFYDERIGRTHLSVPGPDGKLGFGGSCFPKDVNALIYFSKQLNIEPIVLNSVWDKNIEVRPEKDWEQLKGRAVSNKE